MNLLARIDLYLPSGLRVAALAVILPMNQPVNANSQAPSTKSQTNPKDEMNLVLVL
jgi:hypothetical protein